MISEINFTLYRKNLNFSLPYWKRNFFKFSRGLLYRGPKNRRIFFPVKIKLNEIATPFQRHYLQFCFLLSLNQKKLSKKIFKRVWQVVETIFFRFKNYFFVETCENIKFFIFFRILLVLVKENYTKNNDLQYFLFQIKIANAILHAVEVLQRRGALRDSL